MVLGNICYLDLLIVVLETKGRIEGRAEICFQKHQQKCAWEGMGQKTVSTSD